jgi:hypothetical protein
MSTMVLSATLQLRTASPEEISDWDEIVRRFPNHRVVHTLAWIRSLEASGFGRPEYLVFEKAGEIVGCMPGLVTEVGPFRLYGSPPPASQSASMGPVFDERLTTPELMEVLLSFLDRRL